VLPQKAHQHIATAFSTDELSIADKLGYNMWCQKDMTIKTAALSALPPHAAPSAHYKYVECCRISNDHDFNGDRQRRGVYGR
jgi:hypothetical protein